MGDVLEIAIFVADVLERLGVRHLVAGSFASSLHGVPRSTLDVDFVADLDVDDVDPLVSALEGRFYIDAGAVREAIRDGTSFNAIHLESMFKVDVYVPGRDIRSRAQFDRSRPYVVSREHGRRLVVASPEDTIVHKLYWYRLGGEVSDRQWGDAVGIIEVLGDALDRAYLRKAGGWWDVDDLVERALESSR